MIGHQTCFGGSYDHKTKLVEEESLNFKKFLGITDLKIWGDEDIKDFLRDYNKDALYAFLKVIPLSYKSDIARFSLLNNFGGWYSDMGIRFVDSIDTSGYETVMFWDMDDWIDGAMQTSIIYANPGNEVLYNAVERCIYNAKNENYSNDPWAVTGPTLLGNAYRHVCPNNIKFGKTIRYNENNSDRIFKIDGKIVAHGKDFSKQNTINAGIRYETLWNEKRIFNKDEDINLTKDIK